jgi:hypothetical protein
MQQEALFYLCVKEGCNRKYKTTAKLAKHCLDVHEMLIFESDVKPVTIQTKNNNNKPRQKAQPPPPPPVQQGPECALCLDPISAAGVISPCGHGSFCFGCITAHHEQATTCPICRGDIQLITKLFM